MTKTRPQPKFKRGRICRCGEPIPDDKEPVNGYYYVKYSQCVNDDCNGWDCNHEKNPPDPNDLFPGYPGIRTIRGDDYDLCATCEEHESLWHSEHDYS